MRGRKQLQHLLLTCVCSGLSCRTHSVPRSMITPLASNASQTMAGGAVVMAGVEVADGARTVALQVRACRGFD